MTNFSVLWIVPSKKNSPLDFLFAKRGVSFLEDNGIKIFVWHFYESKSILGMLREIFRIRGFVQANGISFLHAQYGSTTALLAFLCKVPYVVTFRGSDLNGDPASSNFANYIRRFMGIISSQFSEATICVSSDLKMRLGPLQNIANVIPSGTKTDLFVPMDKLLAKKELNLDTTKKYIAFASGGRRQVKRFDLAQLVIEKLNEKGHKVELLEIWDIPHNKVPFYVNASELVLLTSEREGSPNIIREGLSCGVPVIAFDVGDVYKWIELDNYSRVIGGRNIDRMVEEAEKILNIQVPRERRVDVDLFSEEASAKKLLNIYKSLH
jgi:teichuronic acid biosynthesis glycosyltransferase TuaC